tara:strand:+ start:1411 stop:1734 length:324 start_codon:yes stop_codon:yes gene_type:complete
MTSKAVVEEMLQQLGLLEGKWTKLERIDAGCGFIVQNIELLSTLPKRVVGDTTALSSKVTLTRRKSVCALARRLAKELQASIIRRRKQVRINKKTVSLYSYRLFYCK